MNIGMNIGSAMLPQPAASPDVGPRPNSLLGASAQEGSRTRVEVNRNSLNPARDWSH